MGMESNRNQIANAHSHTHCQAELKPKFGQRMCLSILEKIELKFPDISKK